MRRQRPDLIGALIGLAIALSPAGAVRAEEPALCPVCRKAQADAASYPAKAGCTLARGAANTLLGWTELLYQPAQEVKGGGNVLWGIGKGVGHGVTRTLGGLAEVLTFWTPKVQDRYLHFTKDCPLCMQQRP